MKAKRRLIYTETGLFPFTGTEYFKRSIFASLSDAKKAAETLLELYDDVNIRTVIVWDDSGKKYAGKMTNRGKIFWRTIRQKTLKGFEHDYKISIPINR